MNRSLTIFLACAFGAGLGALLALQFGPSLWWLGAMIGGLAAYLAYDARSVIKAIPEAYRVATRGESWEGIGILLLGAVGICAIIAGMAVIYIGPWYLLLALHQPSNLSTEDSLTYYRDVSFLIVIMLGVVAGALNDSGELGGIQPSWLRAAIVVLIPTPLVGIILAVAVMVWLWRLALIVPKFVWQLFKLIHSDFRLLCGCDALIGAIVGYAYSNVILGAVAGGVLGAVNYELVSVRWLKLAPAKV